MEATRAIYIYEEIFLILITKLETKGNGSSDVVWLKGISFAVYLYFSYIFGLFIIPSMTKTNLFVFNSVEFTSGREWHWRAVIFFSV